MKNGTSPPRVIVTTAFATLFLWLLFIPVSCKKADRFETTGSTLQNKQEYQKGCFVFSLANLRKITCKYYVAATVNNALYEFDEYAVQDGILPPPNGILILVHCFASSAATPMLNDLKNRDVWDASVAGNYLNTRAGGLGGLLLPSAPDMLYGYDWNNRDNNHPNRDYATDKIKETAYHEFAHASHYRKTTTRMWIDNIKYVVDYGAEIGGNPYGDVGDPGVERTDLIEMWG